jgi:hypothetical protein
MSFVALHFFEMSSLSLESLSYDVLRGVVCHRELKLTNEDSVFELLSKRIRASGDDRFIDLLEFVRFEFLSLYCFKGYFDLVSTHFSQFNVSHWNALRCRLLLNSRSEGDRCAHRSFPYGGKRFWGSLHI